MNKDKPKFTFEGGMDSPDYNSEGKPLKQNKVAVGGYTADQDTDLNELDTIQKHISDVTATYDRKKMDEEASEWEGEEIGFFELMFKYASFTEKLIWWGATLAAFVFGGALPGFCLVFGDMIQDVGGGTMDSLTFSAKMMTYIGVGAALLSFGLLLYL